MQQLPPGSRTIAAVRGGDQFLGWDADRYLTAALLDAVRETTYAVIATNTAKGKKPKPPKPVDRPKRNPQARGSNTAANPFAVMAAKHMQAVRESQGG